MSDPISGLLGLTNIPDDHIEEKWLRAYKDLDPSGQYPLSALIARLPVEKTDSIANHWFTFKTPQRGGAITGIFKDSNCAVPYGAGDDLPSGSIVFAKCVESTAKHFVKKHQAQICDLDDSGNNIVAAVTDVQFLGNASRISLRLLENDGEGRGDLSDCTYIEVCSSINPLGGEAPQATAYLETPYLNYCQKFWTRLRIEGEALKQNFRTGDKYKALRARKLKEHIADQQGAFLWSVPKLSIVDGVKEYSCAGLRWFVKTYAPNNYRDFRYETDSSFAGKTWLEAGAKWFDWVIRLVNSYDAGGDSKLLVTSALAKSAIAELAMSNSQLNIRPGERKTGIAMDQWITPNGVLNVASSADFNICDANGVNPRQRCGVIIPVDGLHRVDFLSTMFMKDDTFGKGGASMLYEVNEAWMTQATIRVDYPDCFAVLDGIGADNIAPYTPEEE